MWDSDEMGFIHDLVFERKISATQGRILELLNEQSEKNFEDWKGKISRRSADEMAQTMNITVSALRHHIRVMESRQIIRQVYIFPDETVTGFKNALRKGIRACTANFYSLDIINKFNEDRGQK